MGPIKRTNGIIRSKIKPINFTHPRTFIDLTFVLNKSHIRVIAVL